MSYTMLYCDISQCVNNLTVSIKFDKLLKIQKLRYRQKLYYCIHALFICILFCAYAKFVSDGQLSKIIYKLIPT